MSSTTDPVVVVISGDTAGMTARCLEALRRHHGGPARLVDVSLRSGDALRAAAVAAEADYLRLLPMRQMYAHAVAVDLLADAGQDEWVVLLDSDCFVHSNDWWPTLTAPMRGGQPAVAAGPARHVSTDVSLVETWSTLVNLRHLASTGLSAVPFQTALGERYADTLDTALTCLQRLGHRVDTVPVAEHALHLGAVTVGAYFLDLFRRDHEAFRTLLDVFIPRERVDFMTASVCRSHELRVLFGDASADDAALERFAEVMECAETLAAQRDLLRHETEPRLREIGVLD